MIGSGALARVRCRRGITRSWLDGFCRTSQKTESHLACLNNVHIHRDLSWRAMPSASVRISPNNAARRTCAIIPAHIAAVIVPQPVVAAQD